jgi:hypothetical protein
VLLRNVGKLLLGKSEIVGGRDVISVPLEQRFNLRRAQSDTTSLSFFVL